MKTTLNEMLNKDFCPWANQYVYWLKKPLGILIVAAMASLLCGLFVAPQGLVIAGTIAATIVLGMVWPWCGLRGLSCPPPSETLEDMAIVEANYSVAVQTGDASEAVREIEAYDDLTRKLQIGHFLRNWELDEFQQTKAKVLRGRLEELRDLVEEGNFNDAKEMSMRVSNAHRRCRNAFEVKRF